MLTEPILKVLRVFSHLPHLVWTFPLSSFILTKFTGVKPPPDHSPHRTAEPWSNWKRWSRSGSNWTMVWFISSVTTSFCKVLILAQNTGCYNVALIYKSSPVHSKILYTPWWCAWCSCLSALSGLAPQRQAVRPSGRQASISAHNQFDCLKKVYFTPVQSSDASSQMFSHLFDFLHVPQAARKRTPDLFEIVSLLFVTVFLCVYSSELLIMQTYTYQWHQDPSPQFITQV